MKKITRHLIPGMAVLAALGYAGVAAAVETPPNLVPFVDTNADADNGNPMAVKAWYVETTANPYSAHLRFGTQVANRAAAGPFQISSAAGAVAQQVITGGSNKTLSAIKLVKDDFGNGFANWSISGLTGYTLTPTSGANVTAVVPATCRVDDSIFEQPAAAVETFTTAGCQNKDSTNASGFVSGIQPGWQDVVPPTSGNAPYFDVTAVTPGVATFTATVDPAKEITETDETDNVRTAGITVPGVTATGGALTTTTTTPVSTTLAAAIVGPDVLGKTQAQATPAKATGALTYSITQPAHGTAQLAGTKVTYTAAAGYTGADQFTFSATDSRGLRGTATIAVTVNGTGGTGGGGGTTGGGGGGITPLTLKLKPAFAVVHKGGKTFVKVSGKLPASQVGRSVKIQRKVGRKVTTVGSARIARTGKYSALVRVKSAKVTLRVTIPASATAKSATTAFKTLTLKKG